MSAKELPGLAPSTNRDSRDRTSELSTEFAPNNSTTTTSSATVPHKYYKVCRLCLTLADDDDVDRMSVFDVVDCNNVRLACASTSTASDGPSSAGVIIRTDGGHRTDDDDDTSTDAAPDARSENGNPVAQHGRGEVEPVHRLNAKYDAHVEVRHRISEFLNIEVSTLEC